MLQNKNAFTVLEDHATERPSLGKLLIFVLPVSGILHGYTKRERERTIY